MVTMTFEKEVPVGIGINTLSETGWWDCAKNSSGMRDRTNGIGLSDIVQLNIRFYPLSKYSTWSPGDEVDDD